MEIGKIQLIDYKIMKIIQQAFFVFNLLFLAIEISFAQHPTIGGYKVFYGHLHNHTSYSDGIGTPEQAYCYAKDTANLDFFGLADHSNQLSGEEWSDTKIKANLHNIDGVFTTFYGFEWSDWTGHISIINPDTFTTEYETSTVNELINWIAQKDVVAFFNHPNRYGTHGLYSYNSSITPNMKFVGMELWNSYDGFSMHYYNQGLNLNDNKGDFDEALSNGWIIGASGSGDDHAGTWGTAQNYRMAILADTLTRANLYSAIKARRFFSTLESDIRLSFKINEKEMGSSIIAGRYSLKIKANDGGGEFFTKVVMYDKNHNRIKTWDTFSTNINIEDSITVSAGDYYYVKVLEADSSDYAGQAISSPIFVSNLSIMGSQPSKVWVCSGSNGIMNSFINGGTGPAPHIYTYNWSPSSGLSSTSEPNPIVTTTSNTSYNVTVTDAYGCSITNTVQVELISIPPSNAGIISGNNNVCQGQNGVIYSVSPIANATSYEWSLPNGVWGNSNSNTISVNYGMNSSSGMISVKGINACGQGMASTLPISVKNSFLHVDTVSICSGQSYLWWENYFSTSGYFTKNYTCLNGCDSIYALNLTVNQTSSSVLYINSCNSYTAPDGVVYTTSGTKFATLQNYLGCDSTIKIFLTINKNSTYSFSKTVCNSFVAPDGTTYTTSGIKTAIIPNASGCDSIITINLTVTQGPSRTFSVSSCNSYEAPNGSIFYNSGLYTVYTPNGTDCDSVLNIDLSILQSSSISISETACNQYIAQDGTIYTSSGIYTSVIPNSVGCDSNIKINLTIKTIDNTISQNGNMLTANETNANYQWVDCNNNYTPIPNQNNINFNITTNGIYAVIVTNEVCSDTSICISYTKIDDFFSKYQTIEIYPIPFKDELMIEINKKQKPLSVKIFNSVGQQIYQAVIIGNSKIPTSNFKAGVYFISFKNEENFLYKKIIKY